MSLSECILLEASPPDQPEDHRTPSWKLALSPFCQPSIKSVGHSTSEFYFQPQNFHFAEGIQMSASRWGLFLSGEMLSALSRACVFCIRCTSFKAHSPCCSLNVWKPKQHELKSTQTFIQFQICPFIG